MSLVEILHNVTPDKVLFCYRQNDTDSLEVAQYYAKIRYLESYQLCPLPVDNVEEIDYKTYLSCIERPILQWLEKASTGDSRGHIQIPFTFCIILGYNIPRVLNYYGEKIALASRIHRLGHSVEIKRPNHVFDRKTWKYFDDEDNSQLYISSVIDGNTKEDAIRLINRGYTINGQIKAGGKILLDPYGNKQTESQIDYQQELLDFIQYDIESFGSEWTSTVDSEDPYKDPTIAYLQNDSFCWGWYQDICSPQMFKDTNSSRIFCYNADNGPFDTKTTLGESGLWANVSISVNNPGYAATAGPVDTLTNEDEYLYPRPFFYSLHRETGIGEAFLNSTKYVDWKMYLVGDPLSVIRFPLEYSETYDNNLICREIVYRSIRTIEDYINKGDRLYYLVNYCINNFLNSPSFDKQYLFYENKKWRDRIEEAEQYISKLLVALRQYHFSVTGEQFDSWLLSENIQVSESFAEIFKKYTSSNISSFRDNDIWELDFIYTHRDLTLENVFFVIELSNDSTFSDIVKTIRLSDSTDGWYYEKEPYRFMPIETVGFASNYSGRRIRYVSTSENELNHNDLYYYRIMIDDSSYRTVSSGQKVI